MKKKLYAINDMKAGVFFQPMMVENDFVAQRSVADAIASGQAGQLSTHTEDFRLWFLGEIDLETGVIDAPEAPRLVVDCISLKKPEVLND